ncbi:amylo-alpha-1,6-glucosidase [Methanocella sp. CWC-04]|uniref:Amylo-alpha-1,6-glucosidase n=1 Tax=Methanooceanicella nereidis TaxID=2052831 RepID=A0AAP2RE14_9EURY|nr:amylo-alpha-1,6-glucosidase [Methanocella sp. CWC-04]MCD1295954.1 amylo-alpha-1,6-glucosidase [Methanocella sp. CWC-04]
MVDRSRIHQWHTKSNRIIDALVIRENNLTYVTAQNGDIPITENQGYGLYYRDCRFLSGYILKINGETPTEIQSSDEKGYMSTTMMTNPNFIDLKGVVIGKETISIRRDAIIPGCVQETISIVNFNEFDVHVSLTLEFDSDFDDIFTVRGISEKSGGELYPIKYENGLLHISYHGQDGHMRNTKVMFSPGPEEVDNGVCTFCLVLKPHDEKKILVCISVEDISPGERPGELHIHDVGDELKKIRSSYLATMECCSNIITSNNVFNKVFLRSMADLRMLHMSLEEDRFHSAGVPWYDALFGRDSIISALQILPFESGMAKSTLRLLAAYQGKDICEWKDESPGKILHELRLGEKANLGEIPHTPYYGSIDSTPLFLILLAEYINWTGDIELFHSLKDNVELALKWIDDFTDLDGSGLVSYAVKSKFGLYNQGWKDSNDAILHSDGTLAKSPIALAEVQGYVYRAKQSMADLYESTGSEDIAAGLVKDARKIKSIFNERFWMGDKKFYAQAIDSCGLCDVISSNPGQALWSGIVDTNRAKFIADRLFEPDMFSGWGIRTLSSGEINYNPLGYHVGTVWPHDNSMISMGLCEYGFCEESTALFSSMYEAAGFYPRYRLPELFGGFYREEYDMPIKYPVACSPQAWSSGTIPYMLSASLGLKADAMNNSLTLLKPHLPPWLNYVQIKDLKVGKASTDLEFQRVKDNTLVNVVKRGDMDVYVVY